MGGGKERYGDREEETVETVATTEGRTFEKV